MSSYTLAAGAWRSTRGSRRRTARRSRSPNPRSYSARRVPQVYTNPTTFDGADLSDVLLVLPGGRFMAIVAKFKYL
eukprot:5405232-Prymnesium_polylepis.1